MLHQVKPIAKTATVTIQVPDGVPGSTCPVEVSAVRLREIQRRWLDYTRPDPARRDLRLLNAALHLRCNVAARDLVWPEHAS